MYLKEQIYVLEIYKQQSLTKAAEKLCISQPALSNYLSNLENSLGTPLFIREKRRLIPTEAGRIYVEIATKMVRLQEKFYLRLNPLLEGTPCVLRIGIQRLRTSHMVPGILEFFHKTYPDITIEFFKSRMSIMSEQLEADELDLILGYYIPALYPESLYTVYPIAKDRLCLAVSEDWEDFDPWDQESLNGQTYILQPKEQSERMVTDEWFRHKNIRPGKIIEEDTIKMALWMAAGSQGIAFTMESYKKYFQVPGVRLYPLDVKLDTLTYALITKKTERLPKYLKDLGGFMKKIF